jgi:sigma-B regulation protein RsbU (phosphoserine phosphatase)
MATLVGQTNRYLVRDSRKTGWFITLFMLEIDPRLQRLTWIRAGHEPGLLFEPQHGRFRELGGEGVALGVLSDPPFALQTHHNYEAGAILFLATDGIRETRDSGGVMFGLDGIKRVLQANANQSARQIVSAYVQALEDFRGPQVQEDDITMVVIKLR